MAALLLVAASCKKAEIEPGPTPVPVDKGADVVFRSAIGGSESGTKTAYAGDNEGNRSNPESINWLSGDQIRIWCAECSEPETHYSDYTVTPESTATSGKIAVNPNTVGLRWSEADPMPTHYFYAVSPSPGTSEKGETWSLGESSTGTPTPFTFTGIIPAEQEIAGYTPAQEGKDAKGKPYPAIATPDMNNLYMVAKKDVAPESETKDGETNTVFLNFRPLSTAIQFTIENAMTAEGAKMQVESVKIISDPKTGTAKNLSGAFEANVSGTWGTPTVTGPTQAGIIYTYNNTYPSCTEPTDKSGQSNAITIDFKNTTAYTEGIAKGGRLQFTFFLLPTQSVDDLSFVITRKDGEGTKTIKTRLAMADGTGIPFPVHKKTYVAGILVPDSAQWTIQYSLDVTEWDDSHSEEIPFYYPDVQEITTVTSWEEVECNPGFEKQNN